MLENTSRKDIGEQYALADERGNHKNKNNSFGEQIKCMKVRETIAKIDKRLPYVKKVKQYEFEIQKT